MGPSRLSTSYLQTIAGYRKLRAFVECCRHIATKHTEGDGVWGDWSTEANHDKIVLGIPVKHQSTFNQYYVKKA